MGEWLPKYRAWFFLALLIILSGCATGISTGNSAEIPVPPDGINIVPYNLQVISRLTGATLETDTFPNTGNTLQYGIGGTDLGFFWKMADGRLGVFFGDTYGNDFVPGRGGPEEAGEWRNNVLAFTKDKNLEDGLTLDEFVTGENGMAKEVIFKAEGSHTAIPTSAISINGVEYVHYFDLDKWNGWVTNFSSLYKSTDGGYNWTACPEVKFRRGSKFSIVIYTRDENWIYMIGSASLRRSPPYLARFREKDILSQKDYQYWNAGKGWMTGNEDEATELFPGPVGEGSIIYNEKFKAWIITYLNDAGRKIELRNAPALTGPWSAPQTLVRYADYRGLYAPYIHPASTGSTFYFTMSLWFPYNVFFMRADLKQD